jgi:hypothetical protein
LRACWWHIGAVMVVVNIAVPAAHTVSIAAAQKPRPEKLWDAYPPDPAPTPTSAPARSTAAPARSAASESDDSGGLLLPALIGGAAFAVGLSAGEAVRRRRRRATAAQVADRTVDSLPSDSAPEQERPEPAGWSAPKPPPTVLPPLPVRSARARGWPEEAARAWTCEIDWKPGYIRSGFRAMVAPPDESRRTAFGQSRHVKWLLMGDAEPPTQDMVDVLQELVTALTEDGWVRVGSGDHWYSQRFLWAGNGQPRPLAPLTGKEANV